MKIVYLARRPIPSVNAHSVQIVKMSEAFGKLGHEVLLLTHRGDDEPRRVYGRYGVDRSFSIESFPRKSKRVLPKWRFGAFLLRHPAVRSADIFFGRDIFSLFVATRIGKPVIFEAHAIPRKGSLRWQFLQRLFASKNFSHLVCVTSTLADAYRESFKSLDEKKIVVVPNGASDIKPGPKLAEWPGRPGATQIGFIGRPFAGKGIELLASAAARMPECDFHVVGAEEHDVDWIESFPRNVHFHGYQPHAKLGGYQQRFDIAVAPYCEQVMNASDMESAAITSPLKLLEYMAAGLPVIVSDLPGVRDILGSDDIAAVVPPGNVDALVKELRRLAADPDLRRKLGAAARQSFLKRHTLEARARRVLAPALAATA